MSAVGARRIRWSQGGGAGRGWPGAGESLGIASLDPFRGTNANPVVQLPTDLDQMTQTIGSRTGGDQDIFYFI